jgi:hypothetical protein
MPEELVFDWRNLILYKVRRILSFGIAEAFQIAPMREPVVHHTIDLDAMHISKVADLEARWFGHYLRAEAPLVIITDPARGVLVLGRRGGGHLPETLILRPGHPTVAIYDDEIVVRLGAAWEALDDTRQEAAAPH